MSLRRSISWSSALQHLRADRTQISSIERRTHAAAVGFAKIAAARAQASIQTRPLFVGGAYNRRAIMSAAIEAAEARRTITREPWNICLSAALKGTWQAAKEVRAFAAHQARRAVECAQHVNSRATPDPVISPVEEGYPAPSRRLQPPAAPNPKQHALSESFPLVPASSASRISAPQPLASTPD